MSTLNKRLVKRTNLQICSHSYVALGTVPVSGMKEQRKKAAKVCDILVETYGDQTPYNRLPPIDELVLTILSQNTSDVNSARAFKDLKARFPTWEEVLQARHEDLAESISSSGLYNIKAKRIKATLSEIVARVGKLDISHLTEMPLSEAKEWLTTLHGVGPKTAAIVLLFSFERPALPVDTHVWRVTKRLGLIPTNTTREKAHDILEDIIEGLCIFSLNHNLVTHGRSICRAQNPKCDECVLTSQCDFYMNKSLMNS